MEYTFFSDNKVYFVVSLVAPQYPKEKSSFLTKKELFVLFFF